MINKFLSNIKITGRTVVLPLLISVLMLAELTVPAFGEVVPVGGKNIQEPVLPQRERFIVLRKY